MWFNMLFENSLAHMKQNKEENLAFLKRMKSLYELASPIVGLWWKSRLDIMIENEKDEHMKAFLVHAREGAKNWWAETYQKEIERLEK